MLLKKIFLFILLTLPAVSLGQWPLKKITGDNYTYGVPTQFLLSKVKYTSTGKLGILFNVIVRPRYDDITIDGDNGPQTNYRIGQNGAINVIKQTSGSLYYGNGNESVSVRGSYNENGVDFETDGNDNVIVLGHNVGNSWSTVTSANGNPRDSTQILLCKTGPLNQTLWYKLYGGSSAEYAVSIKKAGDGNYIVLAQTQSNDGDVAASFGGKDIWLFKIDDNGEILWQKSFGSDKDEIPTDLEVLKDGSIIISGCADQSAFAPSAYAGKNAFLLKLNATGNIIWTKVFGGNGDDKIKSFIPLPDGFASIGTSTSSDGDYPVNTGKNDIYIIKHNTDGTIDWKKHYGNSDDDQAGDIVYTSCDDKIFASYAKQFNGNQQYISNPPYPLFSQNVGVQIGLTGSTGVQFYYFEDSFIFVNYNDDYFFNNGIYNTLAPNDRGGFLAGGLNHWRVGTTRGNFENEYLVRRTFHVEEYGVPLLRTNYDTILCAGQPAYGHVFNRDTTFYDTLRNSCNIDTLINKYVVKVPNVGDSIIFKDTLICYGELFDGSAVTASFTKSDTVNIASICGLKRIITRQRVYVPAPVNVFLGSDTTVCKEGITLYVTHPGATYLWQNGSTSGKLHAGNTGVYWVQLTDSNGCKKTDSVNIIVTNLYLSILHDTTVGLNNPVLLVPSTNGIVNWQFNTALSCQACQQTVASPATTTTFYLTAQKDGCVLNDQTTVTVLGDYLYLPNAFTPNNDGINDAYRPTASGVTSYKMQLYNRWGQLVFETNAISNGWNGRFHGVLQPTGMYVYYVKYTNSKGKPTALKGSFLLAQ